ncbi:leucine aminopeptidase 1 [Myriangium duriaei CBS 260.36]|uniref:Peptide hydrolase n=1 Tax=Myriangium duriaei CBS 260.36 TaxID=1168546 RepID=A0A9P4ISE2_9PEZI|nr:leucine aminopeptidase 1 [Myriangium duriaei CBS 260.36]
MRTPSFWLTLVLLLLVDSASTFWLPREESRASIGSHNDDADLSLIELGPGETRWVTQNEFWDLRSQGINFFDITAFRNSRLDIRPAKTVHYPLKMAHESSVRPLLAKLDKSSMRQNLEKLTSFKNRYYKSRTGAQAAEWLLKLVQTTLNETGATKYKATVRAFKNSWGQSSIIATLPGKTKKTIIVGAHLDSINLSRSSTPPADRSAPGADDDGSGVVTILEALRAILRDDKILRGEHKNTLEFHWYSAEEAGLLGSQAIFSSYKRSGRDVGAMLQQDMVGYIQRTIDDKRPESIGVINDNVDIGLTAFVRKIITSYCKIPFVDTKCGYACSDHASATRAGYPSSLVSESDVGHVTKKLHSADDKIQYLSFDHMLEHGKMTLGFAYELAMADLR